MRRDVMERPDDPARLGVSSDQRFVPIPDGLAHAAAPEDRLEVRDRRFAQAIGQPSRAGDG